MLNLLPDADILAAQCRVLGVEFQGLLNQVAGPCMEERRGANKAARLAAAPMTVPRALWIQATAAMPVAWFGWWRRAPHTGAEKKQFCKAVADGVRQKAQAWSVHLKRLFYGHSLDPDYIAGEHAWSMMQMARQAMGEVVEWASRVEPGAWLHDVCAWMAAFKWQPWADGSGAI